MSKCYVYSFYVYFRVNFDGYLQYSLWIWSDIYTRTEYTWRIQCLKWNLDLIYHFKCIFCVIICLISIDWMQKEIKVRTDLLVSFCSSGCQVSIKLWAIWWNRLICALINSWFNFGSMNFSPDFTFHWKSSISK